ncbi:hypothetical protein [Streptomyces platensis]|uniref:hypothetical protein n=1 Tax=Streptomyces platensis TaxID=58346 RepID=UPI0037A77AF7
MAFPELTPTSRTGNPRCGWHPTDSEPCGTIATWHIAWTLTPPADFSLVCDPHMDAVNHHFVYADRHPASVTCDMPGTGWRTTTPSRCVLASTDEAAVRRAQETDHR